MREVIEAFQTAIQEVYGPHDLIPAADGNIHRFDVPGDKPGRRNGWYVLHVNSIAFGAFGSWNHGDSHAWSSRAPTNQRETARLRQQIEQARRQRDVEQQRRQQQTAAYARRLWRDARRADPEHPYLVAKGCRSHGLRQKGDLLLIPLSRDKALVNLQRIGPDGSKRFLSGGLIKGCCSTLGIVANGRPLYLCEGWATGATLHEHSGAAVACAMNAGNLLPAGEALRKQHPDAVLILAGDDDRLTTGNPGRTAATIAAARLNCGLIFPPWRGDEALELSDFNDLQQWLKGVSS